MSESRNRWSAPASRRTVLATGLAASALAMTRFAQAQPGKPMVTRPIPHSGEQLPVVGLGTAVSFPSADSSKKDALKTVVDALIDGGARLIDTASTYGNAETVIGDILETGKSRERVF